ncbi:hypothetical protein [Laspinema palackyanum]|nr:hypothetical protein [Laspinema sp. D2c]
MFVVTTLVVAKSVMADAITRAIAASTPCLLGNWKQRRIWALRKRSLS